ncbi:hypothetical protein B0H15DRAFT_819537 [Mycena belliarum]|uniref:Nucleoside 2-deoxyribosyltransferase like n=1 Tax=Mycena belliarum TaxID=1033014 RepID=A0AAD6XXW2_9AGAR|nr:hypothetical protein B0H15DRAFT_819537 [Mycena belliae]
MATTSKAWVFKPPEIPLISGRSVFLAGSIEMGAAEDWQTVITNRLSHLPITILNPRRNDWDSSWKQSASDPQFREQVKWELDMLDRCDVIAMYFDPNTKAPISLLELGLFAASRKGPKEGRSGEDTQERPSKLVVCCPDGFYRKGNVEIVCERYKVPMLQNIDQLIHRVVERLTIEEP